MLVLEVPEEQVMYKLIRVVVTFLYKIYTHFFSNFRGFDNEDLTLILNDFALNPEHSFCFPAVSVCPPDIKGHKYATF